jgi:c-di-GMP-binding flagellar brake protein YcgR
VGGPVSELVVISRVERRHEQRISAHEHTQVRVLNPFSEESLPVRMLDRSTNGLSVRTACRLSVGTLVQVRLKDAVVLGDVRYCVSAEGGFKIGIRIESSMPI